MITPAHANKSPIDILDTWVEDGFLFHVAFEAQPANVNCSLCGESVIEFEVTYDPQASNGV